MEDNYLKEIYKRIEEMRNPVLKQSVQDYVNTFFNRKSSNNNVLILGVDDKTIMNEMLGRSVKVIKEESQYFVRIIQEEDRPWQVILSFHSNNKKDISPDGINNIVNLFTAYQNKRDDGWKLSLRKAIEKNSTPNLVIDKDKIDDFLDNPDVSFLKLSGNGFIKSVEIHTPLRCNNGIRQSFKNVHILTKRYYKLIESVGENWVPANFWKTLPDTNIDIYDYNFVILNNENDFLMKAYVTLMNMFEDHFSLKGANLEMIKRVFQLSNHRYYDSVRFKDLPEGLISEIDLLNNDEQDARVIYSLLDKIYEAENVDFSNIENQYEDLIEVLCHKTVESDNNLFSLLNNYFEDINRIRKCLAKFKYDYLDWNSADTINRNKYIGYIRNIVEECRHLAKEYCPSLNKQIDNIDERYRANDARFSTIGNITSRFKGIDVRNIASSFVENSEQSDREFRELVGTALSECESLVANIHWEEGENWYDGMMAILQNDINRHSNTALKHQLTTFLLEKGYNKLAIPINV